MPELPEVQTMASDLDKLISSKKITGVWFDSPSQISVMTSAKVMYRGKVKDRLNLSAGEENQKLFRKMLIGSKIKDVSRRAKNVLINLSGNKILLVHPKMTGHLLVGKWSLKDNKPVPLSPAGIKEKINGHIHLIIFLSNGRMVGLSDARKFAKVLLGDHDVIMKSRDLKDLGPEPLTKEFDLNALREIVKNSRGKVKQFLLNQEKIAGIGNIYADEILWLTKIHPLTRVENLKDKQIENIFKAIKHILNEAVRFRGTSKTDYRDPSGRKGTYIEHLSVYGRRGEKCSRCGTKIERIVIGARSAHFCAKCQTR